MRERRDDGTLFGFRVESRGAARPAKRAHCSKDGKRGATRRRDGLEHELTLPYDGASRRDRNRPPRLSRAQGAGA